MKFNFKNTFLLIALLAFTFSFWSCKDDTEIDHEASMSALLDGTPWNAVSSGFKRGNNITLAGTSKANGKTITLTFKAELGTQNLPSIDSIDLSGVPLINYSNVPFPSITNTLSSATCTSQNGQITITEINTEEETVSGTFTSKVCTLNSSIEITSGKLNKAKYN